MSNIDFRSGLRNQCWTDTVDLDVLDALNTSEILQSQIPKMGLESRTLPTISLINHNDVRCGTSVFL